MPPLAILGSVLLGVAVILVFIGLCLGDRCDWSDDGKTVFWLVAIGLVLIMLSNPQGT